MAALKKIILFCFLGSFLAPFAFSTPLHVVIDPGHGGRDRGATQGSLNESNLTLEMAKRLAEVLDRDPRFQVTLTRNRDITLSLPERAEIARRVKADLFLSLHVNSSQDSRAQGAEFYFQNQLPPDEESMYMAARENQSEVFKEPDDDVVQEILGSDSENSDLAAILQDLMKNYRIHRSGQLSKTLKEHWQGHKRSKANSIRQAPFYVVSNTHVPSVLVEVGFLTHPREAQRLTSASYQKKVVQSLYQGLIKYKESIDKPPL